MASSRTHLIDKLCRELAQAEHDAFLHCARQARQLGACPPAHALRAISEHAESTWPSYVEATSGRRGVGTRIGKLVARTLSATRHLAVDRIIDAQRAYRATLIGLKHGLDCARLLTEVAIRADEPELVRWLGATLPRRRELIASAEDAMEWFAEWPEVAVHVAARRRTAARGDDERRSASPPKKAVPRRPIGARLRTS
jgi:hypothetical protein